MFYFSLRDDIDEDVKDIDIYFLSLNSKIPEILSAALSNHIVVSTLRYEGNQQLSTLSTGDRLQHSYVLVCFPFVWTVVFHSNIHRMDNIMIKFSDLKTEILQSHTNTDELIKLTDELYNACEKYSKVKELFWKVD